MNLVKDFVLHRNPKGIETYWSFRFGSCTNFDKALAAVKSIPFGMREYFPDDDHLWKVMARDEIERRLTEAFDNFASCLKTARAQIPLPGFGDEECTP